ncbi:MAG: hypothetical protein ACI86H_001265 [bacterium]
MSHGIWNQQQFPFSHNILETRHVLSHPVSAKARLSKIRELLFTVSSEIPKVEKPKPKIRAKPKTPLEKLIFDLKEKGIKGKMLFIEVQNQGFQDRETFIAIKNLR